MAAKKKSVNKNITRLDTTTKGYQVRLCRRGKYFTKLFSDSSYGGKRAALKAARDYRDSMIEDLPPTYTRQQLAKKKKSSNTSDIPGVRFVEERDPKAAKGVVYKYWVAQWSPSPGVRKTKRFSVKTYGMEKALQLAKRARNKGVREMDD